MTNLLVKWSGKIPLQSKWFSINLDGRLEYQISYTFEVITHLDLTFIPKMALLTLGVHYGPLNSKNPSKWEHIVKFLLFYQHLADPRGARGARPLGGPNSFIFMQIRENPGSTTVYHKRICTMLFGIRQFSSFFWKGVLSPSVLQNTLLGRLMLRKQWHIGVHKRHLVCIMSRTCVLVWQYDWVSVILLRVNMWKLSQTTEPLTVQEPICKSW